MEPRAEEFHLATAIERPVHLGFHSVAQVHEAALELVSVDEVLERHIYPLEYLCDHVHTRHFGVQEVTNEIDGVRERTAKV